MARSRRIVSAVIANNAKQSRLSDCGDHFVWIASLSLAMTFNSNRALFARIAKGASLEDPARLFNASLDGAVRRAIDVHDGEEVDESAFKALVRQAVALNRSGKSKPAKKTKSDS